MIHKNKCNRRWQDAQKKNRKKRMCQEIWGDAETYKKFDGMYDKGKIHDEEPYAKTNQKKYKGKGNTTRGCEKITDKEPEGSKGVHQMPKSHRLGKNWKPSEIRKINAAKCQLDEVDE